METINRSMDEQHFVVKPHLLNTNLLNADYNLKLKRKNYQLAPDSCIYTIPKLISPAECEALIELGENIGFQASGLAIGQDLFRVKEKTRNNLRVMFEDCRMANILWSRMQQLVDAKYDNRVAYGLNWRFRLYKYEIGGIFAPHVDEQMDLPGEGDLSTRFTFMIYLNDNLQGGETTFFERRRKGQKQLTISKVIRPKTGMGLAFDHLLFHEGSVVTKGVKYALRTDIVYRKL